jgi:hypothetical protein
MRSRAVRAGKLSDDPHWQAGRVVSREEARRGLTADFKQLRRLRSALDRAAVRQQKAGMC